MRNRINRLPDAIRLHAIWDFQHYRQMKKEIEDYKRELMPSSTAKIQGASAGHSGESRPTEALGIRLATDQYILQRERAVNIITTLLNELTEEDKKLIDMVYLSKRFTVEGAGMQLNMSRRTAYDHINKILQVYAHEQGWKNLT